MNRNADGEALALRRQIEQEKRLLECEKAVYLRDAAKGISSTNESREKEARAWALILDEIAPTAIVPSTVRAIKNKPNSFKPDARDVLAAARGEEWQTGEDGKPERVVCANGGAYETWEEIKARAQRAATMALPEPLPPLEVSIDELKRKLGIGGAAGGVAAAHVDKAETEKSDDPDVRNFGALAVDMAKPTGIDLYACTPKQIADLRAFGAWWITKQPRQAITRENVETAWPKFEQWRADERARKARRAEVTV